MTFSKIDFLYEYQREALNKMRTGSILHGGVGSGKSITSLGYYFINEYPKDLVIITTAKKRDSNEWEKDLSYYDLSEANVFIDSWNNIGKFIKKKNSFFIFDEQRVIGSGSWTISFNKITKNNSWILLSATPGDTWMDYIPVFVANGFYKNRTEFLIKHVVYSNFTKFPKVLRYLDTKILNDYKNQITVDMKSKNVILKGYKIVDVLYDENKYNFALKKRFDPFKNAPVKNLPELFYLLRKINNSDISRLNELKYLWSIHPKIIVFYNFDFEKDLIKSFFGQNNLSEYNGHRHDPTPSGDTWMYLVQYNSGAEGWNCIQTDTIVFYSLNYSYRMFTQAAGRIDRVNTPFSKLNYYLFASKSSIDSAILKALKEKRDFNEKELKISFA